MTTLVTGGTGFLGRHVIDLLLEQGEKVRVLARRGAPELERRGVEIARGDVTEPESVERAMVGVRRVLHLAGRVDRGKSEAAELYHVHVDGTRHVLDAAAKAKVERVVHASTSGTIAISREPSPVPNEKSPFAIELARDWPYYLSKIFAEKVALEHAERGLPVVIVQPSLLLGPGDEGLSSSKEIVRFLRREIAAVPPGGLSFVDVRDAAKAVVSALTRGKPGERYLLGSANMTVEAFFVLLEKVSGVPAPTFPLSRRLNDLAAQALSSVEGALGLEGEEATALAMGGHFWYLDASKARAELGFEPRPAEATLRDAVKSIRSRGPLPAPAGLLGRAMRGLNWALGPRR
jgi:dihydroflavonol-4-reductase